jgi:hypothetical protein
MSESAFGVEHGEVSKAFGLGSVGGAAGRKISQGGAKLSSQANKMKKPGGKHSGPGFLKPKVATGMSRTADTLNRVGQQAQASPKVAGGIIGGGSVGLTGGL